MFIEASQFQPLMDLNAELWVIAKYREAFAEKSAFWVIYSDPWIGHYERCCVASGYTTLSAER